MIATGLFVRSSAWNLIDVDVLHESEPAIEFTLFRATAIAAKQ
jgi:hypothetical protein